MVQDKDLDMYNYLHVHHPRAREKIDKLKEDLDLIDPWRTRFPRKRMYTWLLPTPLKQGSLDFFLISSELYSLVEEFISKT